MLFRGGLTGAKRAPSGLAGRRGLRVPQLCRLASSAAGGNFEYIDEWQLTQIKSEDFYDKKSKERQYFYWVDLHGRLYLENTVPKNIATSLKSEKFLDFFFRHMRANDTGEFEEYPFVSPCGSEMNFVHVADSPIVFHSLEDKKLIYAATRSVPFDVSILLVDVETGRMFHPFPKAKKGLPNLGLVETHLAFSLSQHFTADEGAGFSEDGEVFAYIDGAEFGQPGVHPVKFLHNRDWRSSAPLHLQ